MADDLGWEPIPGVAGASRCPHPTRLLTPICSRKRGEACQVDGAIGTVQACNTQRRGWTARQPTAPLNDQEKLFLTKNTLPLFDRLLDILDGIPGEVRGRGASPFFYAGLASRYEDERLTEDDRDAVPDRINELRGGKFGNRLSEREWIPVMLETADKPRRLQLKLDVNEANIDELERQSCEEVFLAREREYQDSYRHISALDELAARYGDMTNRRVYMMSRDVEGRWLDLHRRETGAALPVD